MQGFPPQRCREMDPPLGLKRQNQGTSSFVAKPLVFLSSADRDFGKIPELPQGCQGPFKAQEGRWDFSRDASAEKVLSTRGWENLLDFVELRCGFSQFIRGTSGTHSWGFREVHSPSKWHCAPWDSPVVSAWAEVLIWS